MSAASLLLLFVVACVLCGPSLQAVKLYQLVISKETLEAEPSFFFQNDDIFYPDPYSSNHVHIGGHWDSTKKHFTVRFVSFKVNNVGPANQDLYESTYPNGRNLAQRGGPDHMFASGGILPKSGDWTDIRDRLEKAGILWNYDLHKDLYPRPSRSELATLTTATKPKAFATNRFAILQEPLSGKVAKKKATAKKQALQRVIDLDHKEKHEKEEHKQSVEQSPLLSTTTTKTGGARVDNVDVDVVVPHSHKDKEVVQNNILSKKHKKMVEQGQARGGGGGGGDSDSDGDGDDNVECPVIPANSKKEACSYMDYIKYPFQKCYSLCFGV